MRLLGDLLWVAGLQCLEQRQDFYALHAYLQVEQSHIAEDVIRDFKDHIEYAEAECITGMRQRGDSRRYQIKCVTLQLTVIMCLPFLQAVHCGAVPTAAAWTQPASHLRCNEVQLGSIVLTP